MFGDVRRPELVGSRGDPGTDREEGCQKADPASCVPFIYLDDLLDGFRGIRVEADEAITAAAMQRHRAEQLRKQQQTQNRAPAGFEPVTRDLDGRRSIRPATEA